VTTESLLNSKAPHLLTFKTCGHTPPPQAFLDAALLVRAAETRAKRRQVLLLRMWNKRLNSLLFFLRNVRNNPPRRMGGGRI
jgi:hypothetical protein